MNIESTYNIYVFEIRSEGRNVSKVIYIFFSETLFKLVEYKTTGRHTFSFSEEKAQME